MSTRKGASNRKVIGGRRSTEPFTGYEDTYGAPNYNTIGENSIVLPPVHQSQKLPKRGLVNERTANKISHLKKKHMQELQRYLELEEERDEERDRKLGEASSTEEREVLENLFGKERAET